MSGDGPREEDGDYAREFFNTYERAADDLARVGEPDPCWRGECRNGCYYESACSLARRPS